MLSTSNIMDVCKFPYAIFLELFLIMFQTYISYLYFKLIFSFPPCLLPDRWSASSAERDDHGGGDDDYWYLGGPQRFRANTAYSLYGVLKHHFDNGCNRGTYINSFFTSAGVETIATPLGVDTSSVNSFCGNQGSHDRALKATSADFERDVVRRARRKLEDQGNDDGDDNANWNQLDGNSYGTGCTSNLKYVSDTFAGKYCDGSQYTETTDYLNDFNNDMDQLGCTQVYDSSTDSSAYNSIAYSILSYSYACSRNLYGYACPDPHGIKTKYDRNLEKAMGLAAQGKQWRKSAGFPFALLTCAFTIVGAALLYYSKSLTPDSDKTQNSRNIELAVMSSKSYSGSVSPTMSVKRKPDLGVEIPIAESFARTDSVISRVSQGIKGAAEAIQNTFSGAPLDQSDMDGSIVSANFDRYADENEDPVLSARKQGKGDTLADASRKAGPIAKLKRGFINRFTKKK